MPCSPSLPPRRRPFAPARPLVGLLFAGLLIASVGASPAAAQTVELAVEGLSNPVRLVSPPDDPRLFVLEQNGLVRVFDRDGTDRGVFLDVVDQSSCCGERGLLGLAFAPDYATSGRFYVNYTDNGGDTRVVRYLVSGDDPDRADPASAQDIIQIDQPYGNHNAGHLEFGPDGMLYVGMGDGGSGGDPENRAQDPQSLLGKMLRLDVSGPDAGYAIPDDNPFLGTDHRDEIWAVGLRNPWCWGFDRLTGDLWIADVGQNALEEIDWQPADSPGGENYGWRLMEGTECYDPPSGCNEDGSLTLPVYEYTHGGAPFRCSISGGYVYRGSAVPGLAGRYLFSDYCSDQIWALDHDAQSGAVSVAELTAQLTPPGGYENVVSFGQDSDGELYVVSKNDGRIWRIVADTTAAGDLPQAVRLEQNVPNPFNPRTTIAYAVPAGGAPVTLEVLDVRGIVLRTLVDGMRPEGRQVAVWDGADQDGRALAAGVYLYRLRAPGVEEVRKMALLK